MKFLLSGLAAIILLGALAAWLALRHGTKQPAPETSRKVYVALGDSVAAGAGLETPSDASACDRNQEAYPDVLATQLNYRLTSVACSGATLTNGIMGRQDVNQAWVSPQLNQLYVRPKPTLITMTIGANDIQWTDILARCYQAICGTTADSELMSSRLGAVTRSLRSALSQIKTHYNAAVPTVLVTGYYQLFSGTNTQCPDVSGTNAAERLWWRQEQTSTDAALQSAVMGFGFAHFVPISFSGHELCSNDPWVQGLADGAPFHPNDEGQTAIANQLTSYLRSHHLPGAAL